MLDWLGERFFYLIITAISLIDFRLSNAKRYLASPFN